MFMPLPPKATTGVTFFLGRETRVEGLRTLNLTRRNSSEALLHVVRFRLAHGVQPETLHHCPRWSNWASVGAPKVPRGQ